MRFLISVQQKHLLFTWHHSSYWQILWQSESEFYIQWWQVHFLKINKGYMLHVIPNNRKLFSGRPNSLSIVISIVTTIPRHKKQCPSRPTGREVMTTSSGWVGGYISSLSSTVQRTPVKRTVERDSAVSGS